jgi:CheY-like chemotaxis protein
VDADADVPAAARAEQPDVLLLDVYLSRQDGLSILDTIRRETETQKLNVVMTSGMNLREECLKRGATDFLLKPYMPDELIVVLKKAMNLL